MDQGGDEINIIKLDKNLNQNNYGGRLHHMETIMTSYQAITYKRYAPLNKNHKNYGL